MLSCPISKLTAVNDYHLDLNDFTVQDELNKVLDEKQKLKKEALLILHEIFKEEKSKSQTQKDIYSLHQAQNVAVQKCEEMQKKLEEKLKVKKIIDEKKARHAKMLNFYRKNLGFQLERVETSSKEPSEEYSVSYSFKNINKSDPQESFSLILTIEGEEYKEARCQPPIDSLDELFSALCKNNDLEKFIIQVRRKFCAIAMSNAK